MLPADPSRALGFVRRLSDQCRGDFAALFRAGRAFNRAVVPLTDSTPLRWADLRVDASRTLTLLPGAAAWAVWEIYGLPRSPRGTGRYRVALVLRDARARPWPLRLLERLGIRGDGRVAVRLEWQGERPLAADGRTVEFVAVALPTDAAGDYVLEVTVTDEWARTAAVARKLFIVGEGQDPQ